MLLGALPPELGNLARSGRRSLLQARAARPGRGGAIEAWAPGSHYYAVEWRRVPRISAAAPFSKAGFCLWPPFPSYSRPPGL